MLSKIVISQFRWIQNQQFVLGEKTHIVGQNGSGKTHILDAIHIITTAKNIYGNSKLDSSDRIEVFFAENFWEKNFILMENNWKDNFFIQSKKFTKPKYLDELPFRSVYVSPFDMNILYFAPWIRRDYLDDILSRAYWQFSKIKKNFELVMKQRNALLKKIREQEADINDLDFWDEKFAESAYQYGLYRERYIRFVQEKIPQLPDFFGLYNISIHYNGEWIYQSNPIEFIKNYLQSNRQRDIFSGHTHIGPHRDDFSLIMNSYRNWKQFPEWFFSNEEKNVQNFLSRWEMKMLLLWLKVIESDFLELQTRKKIILLVDDIFAELDEKNILAFLNIIIQHQIILTSQKPLPGGINPTKFTCINLRNQ